MDANLMKRILAMQAAETNENRIYLALARREKNPANRAVLEGIAADELRHAEFWSRHTGRTFTPGRLTIWRYRIMAAVFGLTFSVKLMERGERGAGEKYSEIVKQIPEAAGILADEHAHEEKLLASIDEQRLHYVGSVVLGLSDALVELTGALAGFTLALRDTRLIAAIGLITGVAAAMSMAASEYLSTRHEDDGVKSPLRSAGYTGAAYILTVALLIAPFLLMGSAVGALGASLGLALLIILTFAYYVAVAQEAPLWRRFGEMAGLSLGVAGVSFAMGYAVRLIFGVDV